MFHIVSIIPFERMGTDLKRCELFANVRGPQPRSDSHALHVFLAIGEPPLTMSCSALVALRHAVESAREETGISGFCPLGQ